MKYHPFAITLALATAWPATAREASTLAPSAIWTLDYDKDSCALRREFGEGRTRAYLEFRRFAPEARFQTIIASSDMKSRRTLKYRFGPAGEWSDTVDVNTVTLGNGFSGVIFQHDLVAIPDFSEIEDPIERDAKRNLTDWRSLESEIADKTETVTLQQAFRKDLTLQLGSLGKPIAALNKCVDELTTHWDIDVEAHKTLTRRAVPINLPEVPSMMDYPPKMLRQSMPGIVNVRLAVDETGRITACHIQMPLSDPLFEESSCADIQHALEFVPALGKDGKPIASYWATTVKFSLSRF